MNWQTAAAKAIAVLADTGDTFTADDLLDVVGPPDYAHTPNAANSAIGAAFANASRHDVIRPVGVARSRTPSRKGGLIRVWQGTTHNQQLTIDL